MDFSLFSEASRDHEAEALERRTALVRMAVADELLPFLALASSAGEYMDRKALVADRMRAIAGQCGAQPHEVEAMADRLYTLLTQRQATRHLGQAAPCGNCNHTSVDHTEGLRCQCGCADYQPVSAPVTARKEARQVTAEDGSGPFS